MDKIKEFAQKLEAAGSPLGEDELIFHTLRGLKKGFKGFKTTARLRGDTLTFDELITMLKGEELEMLHDDDEASSSETTSVLVATHSSHTQSQAIP